MKPITAMRQRMRGAALVTALFLMIAVLIIGVSAAGAALNAERSARHERDRHVAFQCAEAALADAERDIEGGVNPGSARAALFAQDSAIGFVDGCGSGAASVNLGLCMRVAPPAPGAWQLAELAGAPAADTNTVPYGKFTGAALPTGAGTLPARAPRYVIELMPYTRAGEDASRRAGNFYRITAIGFGAREHTHVVLQTFYRKAAQPAGEP